MLNDLVMYNNQKILLEFIIFNFLFIYHLKLFFVYHLKLLIYVNICLLYIIAIMLTGFNY